MEITLEMIEQVLEATGADYRTVKQALLDSGCNVEEAIRVINEKAAEAAAAAAEAASADAADAEAVTEDAAGDTAEGTGAEDADQASGEDPDGRFSSNKYDKVKDAFEGFMSDADKYADEMADRLKKRVDEGNVTRIVISREGKTLLDVPVNIGLIGGLLGFMTIPWAMIIGMIAAYGMNCKVEIVRDDGKSEEITVINKK